MSRWVAYRILDTLVWFFGADRVAMFFIRFCERHNCQKEADNIRLAYFRRYGEWPGFAEPPEV
jgi:hypothetical protein